MASGVPIEYPTPTILSLTSNQENGDYGTVTTVDGRRRGHLGLIVVGAIFLRVSPLALRFCPAGVTVRAGPRVIITG